MEIGNVIKFALSGVILFCGIGCGPQRIEPRLVTRDAAIVSSPTSVPTIQPVAVTPVAARAPEVIVPRMPEGVISERRDNVPKEIIFSLGIGNLSRGLAIARTEARIELFRDLAIQKKTMIDILLRSYQNAHGEGAVNTFSQTFEMRVSELAENARFQQEKIKDGYLYLYGVMDTTEFIARLSNEMTSSGMTRSVQESQQILRDAVREMDERFQQKGLGR